MTTKNFVPRTNKEGQLGTEQKKWNKIYSDTIYANNIIGTLTGTADNAIKAIQDKNGNDITEYLRKNEILSLNSDAQIVEDGANIISILNALITKLKQIQGTSTYEENPPTTLKFLNDNKASIISPEFSGVPTAPTASISTNNNQIATTAFIINLLNSESFGTITFANLNANGYVRFSNGFIIQWGSAILSNKDDSNIITSINFPIAFPNSCFTVFNGGLGTLVFDINSISNTGFSLDTVPLFSANNVPFLWGAIGK